MDKGQTSTRTRSHRPYVEREELEEATTLNKRRRTIAHFFFVVGVPLVKRDHGDNWATGGEALPSPPPCGWSQGFLATPRTVGRIPL